MPRRKRCVLPGVPCHIAQRGVDRRETFSCDADRETYLSLLRQNLADSGVRIWITFISSPYRPPRTP
jgi:REP element-mobilizing transposase RayT